MKPADADMPPILHVDADGRLDFTTISAAVDAAPPGSFIIVQPGIYRESVLLKKPVFLIGAGEPGDAVIEAHDGYALASIASRGLVKNLALRKIGTGGGWYSVVVARGRMEFQLCAITCEDLSCVAIHDGAEPTLLGNSIHQGNEAGVFYFKGGGGRLEKNEIFDNKHAGVLIEDGCDPVVTGNRIFDGEEAGLKVKNGGRGTIEGNEIFSNKLSNVMIAYGGDPILRRNRIHSSKESGIFLYEDARGTIEENDIYKNGNCGISITTESWPMIRRNRIRENETGIRIRKGCAGSIESNEIVGSTLAGLRIDEKTAATVRRNRISGNRWGISLDAGAGGTVEDNDLRGNTEEAWGMDPGDDAGLVKSGNIE
ncbi:MAG: right-handed parallel beta-helix repeat-containing protein [Rhodospirillales bacterium]|nr:right-handed parallel beta-helix repeat-containing protein [Rhodospirillales bacterium]